MFNSVNASRALLPVAFVPQVFVFVTALSPVSPSNCNSSLTCWVPPLQLELASSSCKRNVRFKNLLHDNSDKAPISCIDLRVQKEPDQLTDDEEQTKRSLIKSLLMDVIQSPTKTNFMALVFPNSDLPRNLPRCQEHCLKTKQCRKP